MEDIQKLSIDIMDDKVFEPIYTKQYDQGRKVYVTVTKDGKDLSLEGITASFQMKKPDGTVILKNCQISNNQIIVELDRTITVVSGNRIPFQIQLCEAATNIIISTTTGILKVDESVVQMDDIESSSDFSTFSDILLKFNAEYEEVKKDVKEVKALKDYIDNLVKTTEERWSNMIQLKNSQADYDKLSNEQKMNGTLYFVKG
jgi:hypothetical protein|nr:MAG TPA: tail protein [Caudoviricetes sp.]